MAIEGLIHSTVKISTGPTKELGGSGTGFFFDYPAGGDQAYPAIVTNKHVVAGAKFAAVHITRADDAGNPDYGNHTRVMIHDFEERCIIHPDPDVDLAVFPCGSMMHQLIDQGKKPYWRRLSDELIPNQQQIEEFTALEEITMIGYPIGLWDAKNNLPIVRRGASATPLFIDFNGNPEFVIDMACFPGSSGSPVFVYNASGYSTRAGATIMGPSRIILVGVLWGGPQHTVTGEIQVRDIPTAAVPVAVSRTMMNLGYCIKSHKIRDFQDLIAAQA